MVDRWNDDRLDDLARGNERRFQEIWTIADRHESELRAVGVLKEQMATLSNTLVDTQRDLRKLSERLGVIAEEPMKRAADFWRQVRIGFLIALGGGGVTFLGAWMAGAIH